VAGCRTFSLLRGSRNSQQRVLSQILTAFPFHSVAPQALGKTFAAAKIGIIFRILPTETKKAARSVGRPGKTSARRHPAQQRVADAFRQDRASPLHRFVQNLAVSGIIGAEGVGPVLHAEHRQRCRAVVAHRTPARGSHPHHAALGYREDLAVDLELARAGKEEVEFFMRFVRVKEPGFGARPEELKRKFAARRTGGRASEHLARNLDFGGEFQKIVAQFAEFARIDRIEICTRRNHPNLFHGIVFCSYLNSF